MATTSPGASCTSRCAGRRAEAARAAPALRRRLCRAAVVAAVAATGTAFSATAADNGARAAPLPSPATAPAVSPQRIVSMVPSLTETVCELGACARLVGTDRHSDWPEPVRTLPKLGSLDDAQLERIVALRPDLVLVSTSSRLVPRLQALGLRVLALQPDGFAETRDAVVAVAGALGDAEAGVRLWQRVQSRIDAAAARVPPSMRGRRVYFEVSPTPHAAGDASFIGELLRRLGLVNIVPASRGPFPPLSPEHVLRAQPQLVMGSDSAVASMAARPGWDRLKALREHQVCAFASAEHDLLVRPGPRLGEAADLVAACLVRLARDAR